MGHGEWPGVSGTFDWCRLHTDNVSQQKSTDMQTGFAIIGIIIVAAFLIGLAL